LFAPLHLAASLDLAALARPFASVAWSHILLGIVIIYLGYVLRSLRWSILLAPIQRTRVRDLLPAQLIGFSAVAIFGRFADLARPGMIARRLGSPLATQVAIYSIERAFDLASAAILFGLTLALSPHNAKHHATYVHAGIVSITATAFVLAIALAIRISGGHAATFAERLLHPISPRLAAATVARIADLRTGFRTITSAAEFFQVLAVSLLMWTGIALCYQLAATSFRATPQLAGFSFAATMLMMATGLGASLVQLPILCWFTQIAAQAAALHGIFGIPIETATACATLMLLVTGLAVIPAGLVAARMQGVQLRQTAMTQ
jgi:hypothetical protein